MSAFIVDKKHIDYLVNAAAKFEAYLYVPPQHSPTALVLVGYMVSRLDARVTEHADVLGEVLWEENRRSVNSRYREENAIEPYSVEWRSQVSPLVTLKACDCLDYQSCEHDGWDASLAKEWIQRIRLAAIRSLPGYDEADGWEVRS